jgi:thiol-disulfide isomerase/thioredoxin
MESSIRCILIAFGLVVGTASFAGAQSTDRGIVGKFAPSWKTSTWHQLPSGKTSLDVGDLKGKVTYLFFFQSWCPGCHRSGFPTLKNLAERYEADDSVFMVAIQTTFEGHGVNTDAKLPEMASRYRLTIPFGQSAGTSGTPEIMRAYRTGGTPWVVVIDRDGRVRFNDFHIQPDIAVTLIEQLKR